MKIRIEGCTQEEFNEQGEDLTVGKDYIVKHMQTDCYVILDDVGDEIWVLPERGCAHLPEGAQWVEVSE